jgi:hypothetical protein
MLQCVENVATLSVQEGLTETLTAFSCPLRLQESPGIILSWALEGLSPIICVSCSPSTEKNWNSLTSLPGCLDQGASESSLHVACCFSPHPGLSLPGHGSYDHKSWGPNQSIMGTYSCVLVRIGVNYNSSSIFH